MYGFPSHLTFTHQNSRHRKLIMGDSLTIDNLEEIINYLPTLSIDAVDELRRYLSSHNIGDEDPLLLVEYLPRLNEVHKQQSSFQNYLTYF